MDLSVMMIVMDSWMCLDDDKKFSQNTCMLRQLVVKLETKD